MTDDRPGAGMTIFFVGFIFTFWMTSTAFAEVLPSPNELLIKSERSLRGEKSSDLLITLDVKTARWSRHYKMKLIMEGIDHAFARVLEPPKIKGQGFLRIKARLWNYLPTAERTILIPPSLMLDNLLGSDFTNDDMVKMSYLPRDYDASIAGEVDLTGVSAYKMQLIPRPEAPVTYGKLEMWVRKTDGIALQTNFFNERMEHMKTLHYSDFKKFGEHEIATTWKMINHKEKDRQTVIKILNGKFDKRIPGSVFKKENLEKYP